MPEQVPAGADNWNAWLQRHHLERLVLLPDDVGQQPWSPAAEDQKVAWELYTEMRTRISTQPLHYRAGDEQTALDSVVTLFKTTRELLRENGLNARHVATIAVRVLNVTIRPFTARWHKRLKAEWFATEDGRHTFRQELKELQEQLGLFQTFLGRVAEGDAFRAKSESGLEEVVARSFDMEVNSAIVFDTLIGPSIENANEIVSAERDEIRARRARAGFANITAPVGDLVGMAISGGGIRSATFALGVLQGIARRNLLPSVDLLSTVSGGGYLGSFLSSYLNDAETPGQSCRDIGLAQDKLPFVRKERCESLPLRFLRNHSRYLVAGGFWGRLLIIGQSLYGVAMNFLILSTVVVAAVLVTKYGFAEGAAFRNASERLRAGRGPAWDVADATVTAWSLLGLAVFFLPLMQKLGRVSAAFAAWRRRYETACLILFGGVLLVSAINLLPVAFFYFLSLSAQLNLYRFGEGFSVQALWPALANAAAFLSAKGLLWKSDKTSEEETQPVSWYRKASFLVLWLSGPMFLLACYALLCHLFFVEPMWVRSFAAQLGTNATTLLWCLFWLPVVYSFGLLNINFISPHRFYRNRLIDTYLLRPDASNPTESISATDCQLLSQLGRTEKSPYHLLNGALNIPDSLNPELRGRDSDFFLFSKCFCGSPVLGYHATTEWERFDGHLDLGTAMAISGAAASPHMGATTPRGASFILTLLNVRLGCWLRRPDVWNAWPWAVKLLGGPGPAYLLREMFGFVHERSAYVNVSDGGHLENLGVYELLRRRVKFLIAIDGECDANLEFPSLMRVIEFAWIDLGTKIDIDVTELRLTDRGLSHAHFALGTIRYSTGELGLLLYIKLSVTGNEPDYVLDYRRRHSAFPHEPTSDQVFDEDQFEAYRALGEHVSDDLFREELLDTTQSPPTIRDWFQKLADCLLMS